MAVSTNHRLNSAPHPGVQRLQAGICNLPRRDDPKLPAAGVVSQTGGSLSPIAWDLLLLEGVEPAKQSSAEQGTWGGTTHCVFGARHSLQLRRHEHRTLDGLHIYIHDIYDRIATRGATVLL